MTTKDLTQMTPPQVDKILAGYWREQSPLLHQKDGILGEIHGIKYPYSKTERHNYESPRSHKSKPEWKENRIAQLESALPELAEKIAEIDVKIAPYEAEYMRRGGWPRYYLVTSSSPGHVHNSRDCSTWNRGEYRTGYAWLIDLAGKSRREMIAEWGDVVCTVCIPEAPTLKEWESGTKKREAREAKEGGVCPLSGQVWTPRPDAPPDAPQRPTQAQCQLCKSQVKIDVRTRKIKTHNWPKE